MNRRGFLRGLTGVGLIVAAPAIIREGYAMPVKAGLGIEAPQLLLPEKHLDVHAWEVHIEELRCKGVLTDGGPETFALFDYERGEHDFVTELPPEAVRVPARRTRVDSPAKYPGHLFNTQKQIGGDYAVLAPVTGKAPPYIEDFQISYMSQADKFKQILAERPVG